MQSTEVINIITYITRQEIGLEYDIVIAYFYIVVWETIQTSCIFVWFPAYYNIVIGEVVQTRCIVVWFPAYYNTVLGEVVQTMCIFVSVVHAR